MALMPNSNKWPGRLAWTALILSQLMGCTSALRERVLHLPEAAAIPELLAGSWYSSEGSEQSWVITDCHFRPSKALICFVYDGGCRGRFCDGEQYFEEGTWQLEGFGLLMQTTLSENINRTRRLQIISLDDELLITTNGPFRQTWFRDEKRRPVYAH